MLNRKIFFSTSLSLIFGFFIHHSIAQDYSGNIWGGISFNKSDSTAERNNILSTPSGEGGGAVAVDPITMRLLFYSDGNTVYDATHQPMPGGPLNGDPNLNQAAVVSEDPNNPGRYIIFTNTGSEIQSSIVNMNQLGNAAAGQLPLGNIVSANQSTGITGASQAMAVIASGSPLTNYLVYQDVAANTLVVREIGPSGALGAAYSVPIPATMTANNVSFVELADGTFRLALAPENANRNVQLFTFDPSDNSLVADGPVLNSAGPEGVYDTEWSANGRYLYISKQISPTEGQVYQYDTQNPSSTLAAILPSSVSGSYGLQLGVDGSIYHVYQNGVGSLQLGRIDYPDSVSALTGYDQSPLGTNAFPTKQFTSTLAGQSQPFTISFTTTSPICQNSTAAFFPSWDSDPAPSQLIWDFGDTIIHAINPTYLYEQQGAFPVSLTAIRGSDTAYYQQNVIVTANDLSIDLGMDTVICPGETVILDIGEGIPNDALITWSDGGIEGSTTGRSITVDTTGTYWVTVTLSNGCSLYDAIQVELYGEEYQRANFWYFGNQAGIDFNQDPNDPENPTRPVTDGQMTAPEGSATISDVNGDLLLYTNGESVWGVDRTTGEHVLLDADIGGSTSATQSALIVPLPGDETLYYIFTVESNGDAGADNQINLTYTLVDIKAGVAGEIVEKNVPLFSPSGERITAVEMNNGTVLLAHELGGNTFYAFPITENGIGTPVLSSAGSVHDLYQPANAEGYMEFSPDGSKVAVALSGPANTIEIFDFVDSTLTVTNPITLTFDEPYSDYQVYGIEFSPGLNKLFVTLLGNSGSILYEVRIDTTDEAYLQQLLDNQTPLYQGSERLGAIQIGPDRTVYVAVEGAGSLGTIDVAEDTLLTSTFNLNGFDLGGATSSLGLPNIIQSYSVGPGGPGISVTGAQCVGSEVSFTGSTSSVIDELSWTIIRISDNNLIHSSTEEEFTRTFNTPGEYRATLRVWNRCDFDTTMIQNFIIHDNPEPPTLAGIYTLCTDPVTLDADNLNRPALTYLWSTGATTKTIEVAQDALINVTITDANGCSADRETEVVDARLDISLGPDQTVCQFEPIDDLNTGISNAAGFTWYIDNVVQPTTNPSIALNSDVPGDFIYRVEVTDPYTSCVATDEVLISIKAQPDLDVDANNAACNASGGELIVTGNPDFSFEWIDASNNPVPDPSNVSSGVYHVIITDPVSGCTQTKTQGVNDGDFNITSISSDSDCNGGNVSFSVDIPGAISYTLTNNQTAQMIIPQTNHTINNVSDVVVTGLVPEGEYTLEVINNSGCRQTRTVAVTENPEVTFDVVINSLCRPDVEVELTNISGSGTDIISWYDPNGNPVTGDNFLRNVSTAGVYRVTVSNDLCEGEASVDLNINDNPMVIIEQTRDGCNSPAVGIARPNQTGSFSYQWSPGGSVGPQISFDNPGEYTASVTAVNMNTGCSGVSGPATFNVYGEVVVEVSSTVPCEDGKPILLTATPGGNQPNLEFNWFNQAGSRLNAQSTRTFEVMDDGTYRVEALIPGTTCSGQDIISLSRLPLTPTGLLDVYTYCSEDPMWEQSTVLLLPTGSFIEYNWYDLSNNSLIATWPELEISGGDEGQYLAQFTNVFGCVTSDTVSVDNDCIPTVYVPNAFTPNSDNKNDYFVVFPRYIQQFEIFIFSRWGEVIFHSTEMDFKWDGRLNGKLLPVGTYPYLMRYRSLTDPNRGVIEQRGGVLLLK